MLWKFLFLTLIPFLCGILVTIGFGVFEWDRIYGFPDKVGALPKLELRNKIMFEKSELLQKAIDTTNGALLSYVGTKSSSQKELLNKALDDLPNAAKQFADERRKAYDLNSSEKEVDELAAGAIKASRELEQAIEQGKGEQTIASLATNAGSEMTKASRQHRITITSDSIHAMIGALMVLVEILLFGTIAYVLASVLILAGFTWSCHKRAKTVEDNLRDLGSGKPLRSQIKGGGDCITTIDHLVHQVAETVKAKSA